LIFFGISSIKLSERIINTIILGIIINTLFVYLFNRLGMKLTYFNMLIAVLVAIITPIFVLLIKKYLLKLNLFKKKL
jgi:purine-cytosine permease-like protein